MLAKMDAKIEANHAEMKAIQEKMDANLREITEDMRA
jgi:hypothetical protein